nr:MAG TPA: hypothetical protein [Caudoviricetes sp.]
MALPHFSHLPAVSLAGFIVPRVLFPFNTIFVPFSIQIAFNIALLCAILPILEMRCP